MEEQAKLTNITDLSLTTPSCTPCRPSCRLMHTHTLRTYQATFVLFRADPSLSAGNTAATAGSSRPSATFCDTSVRNQARPPRPAAPTVAPNSRGRLPGMGTCSTKSASRRGKDSLRRAAIEDETKVENPEEKIIKEKRRKRDGSLMSAYFLHFGALRYPGWPKTVGMTLHLPIASIRFVETTNLFVHLLFWLDFASIFFASNEEFFVRTGYWGVINYE